MTPDRDAILGARLSELASYLDYPPTPDVASGVAARLRAAPRPPRTVTFLESVGRRRALILAAAALVVLMTGLLIVSPEVRTAVAGWLGLPGVRIEVKEGQRPPNVAGTELNLGRPASLEEARAAVSFEILEPTLEELGAPDGVFLGNTPAGGRVTFVFDSDERLPRTDETGLGLLLTQFEASLNDQLIEKLAFEGTRIEPVSIGDDRGYWLGREPHIILYENPLGGVLEDTVRLAGNTLVWQHGSVTLRLESALSKREAVRVAESVR